MFPRLLHFVAPLRSSDRPVSPNVGRAHFFLLLGDHDCVRALFNRFLDIIVPLVRPVYNLLFPVCVSALQDQIWEFRHSLGRQIRPPFLPVALLVAAGLHQLALLLPQVQHALVHGGWSVDQGLLAEVRLSLTLHQSRVRG